MGVKDTMNNFFTSMSGQVSSGSGQKSITTPMGPFRWDDNLQMWVNIALQDQFAMMDYDVTNETGVANLYDALTLSPSTWGNLADASAGTDAWSSSSGSVALALANNVLFKFTESTPTISVTITKNINATLGGQPTLIYSKNGGAKTSYAGPITIVNGDLLKVGLTIGIGSEGDGTITVTNATTGRVLGIINAIYS